MINEFVDTHIHLDLIENNNEIVKYAERQKIYMISVTNHPKVFAVMHEKIQSRYVRIALGMHPQLFDKADIKLFMQMINKTKYVGEIGLDFSSKINSEDKKRQQIEIFKRIINACENKFISIHSRKAEKEVVDIISKNINNSSIYVLHWYTGGKKVLKEAIKLGCYFSININMLRHEKTRELISLIPKDRILTESDAPFAKNIIESYYQLYEELAKFYSINVIEARQLVFDNFKRALKTIS